MKKLITIGLALVLVLALAAPAVAQSSVEPSEVNIVLPDGATANITKTVDAGGSGLLVNASVVLADPGLDVDWDINPVVSGGDNISSFQELISMTTDPSVGVPLYATVNFTVGSTVVGTQTISVSEGDLDIKPGSYPNTINRKKKGVTPVAILGSASCDVSNIDVTTIIFGPNNATPVHLLTDPIVRAEHTQDVNFDGWDDLVCHFNTRAAGFTSVGQYLASLTYDSTIIQDQVTVIK